MKTITLCENETTPVGAPTPDRGLNHLLDYTEKGSSMKATRVCSLPNCDRPHRARGWCAGHYNRWRATGDPGTAELALATGEEHHHWNPTPGYRGAHLRVQRVKGRAAAHACTDCGVQAAHWSYVGGDPAELTDERGCAYSGDPGRYVPRCVPCHSAHDGGVG